MQLHGTESGNGSRFVTMVYAGKSLPASNGWLRNTQRLPMPASVGAGISVTQFQHFRIRQLQSSFYCKESCLLRT